MTGHLPKTKPVDDPGAVAVFAREHPYCQACGADYRPLQTHHILGGRAGRSDEWCNLLRVCGHPCHLLAEQLDVRDDNWIKGVSNWSPRYSQDLAPLLPKITDAVAIQMKLRDNDIDEAGLDRLEVLNLRPLPAPESIPEFFQRLWKANRPEKFQ